MMQLKMEPSWNSPILEGAYTVCGWLAFFFWSSCFYPQVILNLRRKSVVGFNFNYALLNNTKNTVYFIYNACFYFSPAVQLEYHKRFGFQQRGNQTFSKFTVAIVSAMWLGIAVCFFVALPGQSWLWFLSILTSVQVCITCIKYIPQAFMNFSRKSTDGFSIGYVLLDFSGGTLNYAQMIIQSIDQNSWVNLYGNIGKVLLSLVSMLFSLLFICQHYLLYPTKKAPKSSKLDEHITEPLIPSLPGGEITTLPPKSPNKSLLDNV